MGKLGYSSLTLTDITETIPVSLALQSNLDRSLQVKNGNLYTPNFTEAGKELIITPSLFLGSTEIAVPTEGVKGAIYYQISGEEEGGVEKNFYYSNTSIANDIYVDEKGCLHYKKNLETNVTFEAYINDYWNETHGYTIESINAANPITILLLEQGSSDYSMIITSADGREHFEENNSSPITLTAFLYKGATEVPEFSLSYEWDIATDEDDKTAQDWKKTTRSIVVTRAEVSNVEAFQCLITLKDGSGLSFSAQKILRDFTDGYTNQIIADAPLIITPQDKLVVLYNQVWYQSDIINGETADQSRFKYTWKLLTQSMDEKTIEYATGRKLSVEMSQEPFSSLKENFSILGTVLIDGKAFTANYADFKYSPIEYSVDVSPRSVFIPVNKDGAYQSENYTANIIFKLVDEKKKVLDYDAASSLIEKDEYVSNVVQNTDGKWDYTLTLSINKKDDFFSSSFPTKNISISYTYLGEPFTETIQLIKNFAGADGMPGKDGAPSYNIFLSNDYYLFAGGETAATVGQTADFNIYAYYGAEELYISNIKIGNYLVTNLNASFTNQNIGITGLLLSYNATTRIFSLTTQGNGNFLTSPGSVLMEVAVKETEGSTLEKVFLLSFNYGINYNGNSYSLIPSENQIIYLLSQYKFNLTQLILNATYRSGGVGASLIYTDGYITYAVDGKGESTPVKGSTLTFDISKLNVENTYVKFNLYKDSNKTTLLDTQTVPILCSYEGIEIGGENLIRWSKKLTVGNTKWYRTNVNNISFGNDGDFSTMEYAASGLTDTPWQFFGTPKIKLTNDLLSKKFCFSCMVKIPEMEEYSPENDGLYFTLCGYTALEGRTRDCYKTFGSVRQDGGAAAYYNLMKIEGEWKVNEWNKIYKIIDLSEITATDHTGAATPIEECSYFGIHFYFKKNGKFSIKQPKLEIGNYPSAWSASPEDIDYTTVVGSNLSMVSGFQHEIRTTDPYLLFVDNLEPSTYYTFSCANAYVSSDATVNNFLCQIRRRDVDTEENDTTTTVVLSTILNNSSSVAQSYTFQTPETVGQYSFRIYANNSTASPEKGFTLTIQQAKIEKGTEATPFFMTEDYVSNLIESLQDSTELNSRQIEVLDENGRIITLQINDVNEAINKLNQLQNSYVKIDEKNAIIEAASRQAYQDLNGDYISLLKGYIDINASDASNPYIQIASKSGDSFFATKITNNQLGFYYNNETTPVAYINKNELQINQAKFNETFSIGDLKVAITESGVGFTW